MDPNVTAEDQKAFEKKQANMFKGTIAVCVTYAFIGMSLFLIMVFNEKAKILLADDLFAFTATLIGGMIFIVIFLIIEIITFKLPRTLAKSDGFYCPDYWKVEKTPDSVLQKFPSSKRPLLTYSCVPDPNVFGEFNSKPELRDVVYEYPSTTPTPTTSALASTWYNTYASELKLSTVPTNSTPEGTVVALPGGSSSFTPMVSGTQPKYYRVIYGHIKSDKRANITFTISGLPSTAKAILYIDDVKVASNFSGDSSSYTLPIGKDVSKKFKYELFEVTTKNAGLTISSPTPDSATISYTHISMNPNSQSIDQLNKFNSDIWKQGIDEKYKTGCTSRIYPLYLHALDNDPDSDGNSKLDDVKNRCEIMQKCNQQLPIMSWTSVCPYEA
jgi:hypothetical protein